ncbi:MAG: beta-ketoacyl-[acyl-carrier-protein] synthase family protein [Planctomycetaceae bacterium]
MSRSPIAPFRIAITGLGGVTPHADNVEASWTAILQGRRAVRLLSSEELGGQIDASLSSNQSWSGAPAVGIDRRPSAVWQGDPVLQMADRTVTESLRRARLTSTDIDPDRIGCVFGTSKGGLDTFQRLQREVTPTNEMATAAIGDFWSSVPPSAAAASLSAKWGWQGPSLAPVAACATGLVSLIRASALIRDGRCDVVVAGSSDASLQPALLASFRRLGVLASVKTDPGTACRPFDARRRGFVAGEGAAALVLERWDHAVARRVPILAEWVDGLQRADPHGLTLLPADPKDLVKLLVDLLRRTDMQPSDIDAVSLHGTGTRMNDAYEAAALRALCGRHADHLRCFALKGGIGHLLGAAGSVESLAAVCALRDQVLPPTVNCDWPAADCQIPVTGPVAENTPVRTILKLSLGFGGHLAAGLLRRVESSDAALETTVSAKSV